MATVIGMWKALIARAVRLSTQSPASGRTRLSKSVVLLTGGSRGLGFLIARQLTARGAKVALCARDERELDEARRELSAKGGGEVQTYRCDVRSRAEVDAFVERARTEFGRIDVVINNAGIIQAGPLDSMTQEDFEDAMAINFFGVLHTTLAVLPHFRERRHGHFVNITSVGGRVAIPHLLPYDCAKFAAVGLSEGLRAELAGTGIAVTTVVPGLMRVGSHTNALFKGKAERELTWFALGAATPLTSMDADRAARKILRAIETQRAYVTLGWQAKVLQLAHDLFPGRTTSALGIANQLLPQGVGQPTESVRGMNLASSFVPSWVTVLINRAAERTHQFRGGHAEGRAS